MLFKKIESLALRHQMPPMKATLYELFIRLYERPLVRPLLRVFIPKKQPTKINFVMGCYNSGTTVVKKAIALHPDIAIAPVEGDLLTNALPSYEQGGWPRCMVAKCYDVMQERRYSSVDKENFISDLRPWIKNKKVFLEKSISNACRIPLLRNAFPKAKFVCVTREAEGVIQGIQRRSKPSKQAEILLASDQYPHELLLRQWVFFYSLLLKDYKERSDDIYICSYEKFIQEPEIELKKIYDFLELDSSSLSFKNNQLSIGKESLEIRTKESKSEIFIDNLKQLEANIALNIEKLDGKIK